MLKGSSGRRLPERGALLVEFVDTLPPKYSGLARCYYGIDTYKLSEKEIAKVFKISEAEVIEELVVVRGWLERVDLHRTAETFHQGQ
jgi:hypothetical protein